MVVFRTVNDGVWDMDNFEIFYKKAFQDTIRDAGLIPDDSIRYLLGICAYFVPITNDEERKLIFRFHSEYRPENPAVYNHLLYRKERPVIGMGSADWKLRISEKLNSGQLFIDRDTKTFFIGIGKKYILWNALRKVLTSIAYVAINENISIEITSGMYNTFGDEIEKILLGNNIQVMINVGMIETGWTRKLFDNTIKNKENE